MTVLARLRRQLLEERGTAIVVAMGAMSVILVLSAWAASASTQLGDSSERDRSSKRALPATEAGLRQALYTRNNVAAQGACPTGEVLEGTYCKSGPQTLGNGVTYTYWTSTTAPDRCAGFPRGSEATLEVRCVTAEATVNGVTRRSQARLVRAKSSLFPFKGVFGDELVHLKNNSTANEDSNQVGGSLGSNVRVRLDNSGNCIEGGILLGTQAATPPDPGRLSSQAPCESTVTRRPAADGAYVLTPVDPGTSVGTNQNLNGVSGSRAYTNVRKMDFGGDSATFNQGVYNFCYLEFEGGTVTINGNVTIFIDSPSRDGSLCQPGGQQPSGNLKVNNTVTFANAGAAENFKIFVYGGGSVDFKGGLTLNGYIHAPDAAVTFENNATITGGVAANTVTANNQLTFNASDNALPGGQTTGRFSRTAWRECSPQPTTSDPGSGC